MATYGQGGSSWGGAIAYILQILWEYRTITIACIIIILILVHNFQGMMEQPTANKKMIYLFDHLITPIAVTDIMIYKLSDEIFNPTDNVFKDFKKAPDLKNKAIQVWNIIKTLESMAFYICYFILIFSAIYWFFEWRMAYEANSFKFFMTVFVYGLLLMNANLALLNETTDEEHFVEHITRVMPYRGLAHLGVRLYQVFFVSAYDLFQDDMLVIINDSTSNMTYYNETTIVG